MSCMRVPLHTHPGVDIFLLLYQHWSVSHRLPLKEELLADEYGLGLEAGVDTNPHEGVIVIVAGPLLLNPEDWKSFILRDRS